MRLTRKIQQRDSIIDQCVFHGPQGVNLPLTPLPFLALCRRHAIVHVGGDASVEVVHVEDVQSLLKAISLVAHASDRLHALPAFVQERFADRSLDEAENLIIDIQSLELMGELAGKNFFANIFFRTFPTKT